MLLVASETGHVYTFATKKLQPMIMSSRGKALIEACLSSPDVQLTFNGSPESSDFQSSSFNDIETTPLNRKRKIVPDDSEQLQYFYDPEDDSNIQARVRIYGLKF